MSDIYLKIAGVDGDVTDAEYAKHVHVFSLELGGTNPSSVDVGVRGGSAGGGGKVIMQDVVFTKECDRSTPSLTTNFFTGKHFTEFEFKYVISRGSSSDVFKSVKLTDVLITSFQHSGDSDNQADQSLGTGLPVETISLNFAKIEFSYRPRHTGGGFDSPIKAGYDVALARVM